MLKSEHFVVDASLVQELGERLIGRPAIALAELIKNSYDADASTCAVEFGPDTIVISDDGAGMSDVDFLQHWMRIGTTHKVDQRFSRGLGRPLTGSKGVGRLSVQFLADEMELETTTKENPGESLYVLVDWKGVVRGKNLDSVNVQWEVRSDVVKYADESPSGTKITLRNLKSKWDAVTLEGLGREVWRLRSPFKKSSRQINTKRHDEFDIDIAAPGISGAREAFDKVMQTLFSNWKARIRGTLESGRLGSQASITVEFKEGYPEGSEERKRFREVVKLPISKRDTTPKALVDQATFEILIFKPEGRQPIGVPVADLREYLAEFGNVSLYDAGFRLPYYGSGKDATGEEASGQDWLAIALDQGRRLNASELLPEHLKTSNKYMQDLPAPGRIFGAVEIDTNHERAIAEKQGASPGEWLQIQPGRDRLHDNRAFAQLRDLVRFSLDFYANRYRLLAVQAVDKRREQEPASRKFDRAIEVLERNKSDMPALVYRDVKREVADARKASVVEEDALDRRAALLAPLASAGMAALALNHELARETRFLDRIGTQLRRLAKTHSIPDLARIADEFGEAKRRLDSLQELFAPLLSDMDKRATDRLKIRAVVEQAVSSMAVLMPGVSIDLAKIPAGLRFPVGSLAEWNALLQNILSNAWNAMLDTKKAVIAFHGGQDGRGREWLHVSDTGKGLGIPLSEAPKLFEPFERRLEISDDKRSIAIGGQGLGLAIVRMIARRRSATVSFVKPEAGFSATFEIAWRGSKR